MPEPEPFAKRLDAHLAGGWTNLGFSDGITPTEPEPLADIRPVRTTPEPFEMSFDLAADVTLDTMFPPPPTRSLERSLVMEFPSDRDIREVLGFMAGSNAQAITIHASTTLPNLPPTPRKGRRLQGKRYRIARRGYGRAVRAWRKAGRPTRTTPHRVHIPRASIAPDGPNSYSITPLSPSDPVSTLAWFGEVVQFADDRDAYVDADGMYRSHAHPGRAG